MDVVGATKAGVGRALRDMGSAQDALLCSLQEERSYTTQNIAQSVSHLTYTQWEERCTHTQS